MFFQFLDDFRYTRRINKREVLRSPQTAAGSKQTERQDTYVPHGEETDTGGGRASG